MGNLIKPGQAVVAVREEGFRSNGISLVRRILSSEFGADWHKKRYLNRSLGLETLKASRIYTPLLIALTGGYCGKPAGEMTGAAHITGGGIPGKLGRLLRDTSCGATLEHLFDPPKVMALVQNVGGVSDEEAYRSWNMGQGLLITTPVPATVIGVARKLGFEAKIAGTVDDSRRIHIASERSKKRRVGLYFDLTGRAL